MNQRKVCRQGGPSASAHFPMNELRYMSEYYSSHPKFYVSVDCIIFGFDKKELHLLLLKRNFQPAQGEWSLMGGFVQVGESTDEAARRVLKELTGLDNVYMEQVGAFGAVDRDPGERVVSVAYCALININAYEAVQVKMHNAPSVSSCCPRCVPSPSYRTSTRPSTGKLSTSAISGRRWPRWDSSRRPTR